VKFELNAVVRTLVLLKEKHMSVSYRNYTHTKMPFGKYSGYFLKDLPLEYLKWLVMNIQDRASAEMFSIELQRRNPKLRK